MEGSADFRFNEITANNTNGVVIIGKSPPKICDNLITFNEGIGLYIKDLSHPELKNN